MPITLLLDLDDTLLGNKAEVFLPPYTKALAHHLSPYANPDQVAYRLMYASQAMVNNTDPALTLEQVFDANFYPYLGLVKEEIDPVIASFYRDIYPNLRDVTIHRKEALWLVESALEAGARIVIATNPVFPRTALVQRLEWAGLASYIDTFAMITSYEIMHFAKPNPAYFAEIQAQLGWPSDSFLMVGNSLEDDIVPSGLVGIPGLHIHCEESDDVFSVNCGFSNVINWVKNPQPVQEVSTLDPVGLIALLRSTPAAAGTLTSCLKSGNKRPLPNEWSVVEILSHLADLDLEVMLPRWKKIVQEETPFLAGALTDGWVTERKYNERTLSDAVAEFASARSELVSFLAALPAQAWQRSARHAIFGATTLSEQIAFAIQHDQMHIQQLQKTIRLVTA